MSMAWYENLPKRWYVVPNRVVFTERKTKNDNHDAQLLSLSQYSGVSKKSDTTIGIRPAESLIGYSIVKKNDIVMNIMLAWNGSQAISPFNGVISPAYAVFSVRGDCNPWYYHYLMRTPEMCNYFSAYSTGVIKSRLRLYPEIFRTLKTLLPPSDEQDQIVRFLDWKVSQINRLINAKRRQIELLREQKQTVINEAVTKGWERWQTLHLRSLLTPISKKNYPNLPLLSVVRERGIILRNKEDKEENHNYIPDDLSNYKLVQCGQFVMNKMKAWQGSYGVSNYEGIVSPAYYVFNLKSDCCEFFHKAIRSRYYVDKFAQYSIGIRIGQWDLPIDRVKEIEFLSPPLNEQLSIVAYLDKQCANIDRFIDKLNDGITRLAEYRIRLISDTVTGKLDVRDVVVPEYVSVVEDSASDGDDVDNESMEDDNEEEIQ
jgi:type I restriction enzyme, S subunit